MLVVKTVEELKNVLFRVHSAGKSVGFVPTMGALHEGHLALLQQARSENEAVVCSIFVNPMQFNNDADLQKYPRTLEADLTLLQGLVDVVFAPSKQEVFPEPPTEKYDFGQLETVMEGTARPGHFNGVAIIVKRLFEWINPEKAYFGEKDFQQLVIVKKMAKQYKLQTEIVSCPIVREESGLAFSSRNKRLSDSELNLAANINRILRGSSIIGNPSVEAIKSFVTNELDKYPALKLDYFEIVNAQTLQPVETLKSAKHIVGCIAVYVGEVRLIDNIRYK
ncbi:MAG: pantoate--beta-alanine ligase [Bacteroidales bacterium]|jgi:pantoate--beta-alanine ligase|nr:pantoate--beta-alanine ligase [Bacteroidales bacterium]